MTKGVTEVVRSCRGKQSETDLSRKLGPKTVFRNLPVIRNVRFRTIGDLTWRSLVECRSSVKMYSRGKE